MIAAARQVLLLLAAVSVAALAQTATKPAPATQRPNILFILVDNLGYGVPSRYNSGILDTPTRRQRSAAASTECGSPDA